MRVIYLFHDHLALLQTPLIPQTILFVLFPVKSLFETREDPLTSFRSRSPSLARFKSSSLISFNLCENRILFSAACNCKRSPALYCTTKDLVRHQPLMNGDSGSLTQLYSRLANRYRQYCDTALAVNAQISLLSLHGRERILRLAAESQLSQHIDSLHQKTPTLQLAIDCLMRSASSGKDPLCKISAYIAAPPILRYLDNAIGGRGLSLTSISHKALRTPSSKPTGTASFPSVIPVWNPFKLADSAVILLPAPGPEDSLLSTRLGRAA